MGPHTATTWVLIGCLLESCVAFHAGSVALFSSTHSLEASMVPKAGSLPLFKASLSSPLVGAPSLLPNRASNILLTRPGGGPFVLPLPLAGRAEFALQATLDRNHNFDISPNKVEQLFDKIEELGIDVQQDIEEKFVRGSGAGGQKINKTASCVQMRHMPTGLQVSCQRERTREKNRFLALRQLVEKIEASKGGGMTKADKALEKKRKQKSRRKRRTSSAKKATSGESAGEETTEDSEELSRDEEELSGDDDTAASQADIAKRQ